MAEFFAEGEELRMGFPDEEDSSAGVAEIAGSVWAVLSVLAASLLSVGAQKTEIGAEAEAIYAELERGATAVKEALEEGFEFEGAGYGLIDFGELAGGEYFPARADRGVVAETAEEELDFGESEAHVGGEANEKDAVQGVTGIAALSAEALGYGEQAHFFVVADGGGVEVGAGGEFTDSHDGVPEILLDLKLTLTSSIEAWDVANPI
jgi:hypothetical protein